MRRRGFLAAALGALAAWMAGLRPGMEIGTSDLAKWRAMMERQAVESGYRTIYAINVIEGGQ